MQDAFAYCAELVRTADRDRFLATLFAPAEHRDALHALYAFNVEVARVREVAHQPLAGEIRLQWWAEVLGGDRSEEAQANPVASALLAVIERYHLDARKLMDIVEARRFDLYDEPMAMLADFEAYARKVSSAPIAVAAHILAGHDAETAAGLAGIAVAVAGLLRAFPLHASRGQLYVPVEFFERHGVDSQDVFAGRSTDGLRAVLAELRTFGFLHLAAAAEPIAALPSEAWPAFLPLAPVHQSLDRQVGRDPFLPVELAPWRRQWLIWRAARNPVRMTR
jgi:phytoene synthase